MAKGAGRNEARGGRGEVFNSRLFLSYNVSILKFNTWMLRGAKRKIPWLMMFDVDLQITFFKLLRKRNKINSWGKLRECRKVLIFLCFLITIAPLINYVDWITAFSSHRRMLIEISCARAGEKYFFTLFPSFPRRPLLSKNNSGEKFRKWLWGGRGWGMRFLNLLFKWVEIYLKISVDIQYVAWRGALISHSLLKGENLFGRKFGFMSESITKHPSHWNL